MEVLVVLWAIGYAIAGAFQEGWRDGRAAAASGARAVKARTAAGRTHPNAAVRAVATLATGIGSVLVGGGRAVRGTGRSLTRGARAGYVRGRARGRVRVRRIRREREQRRPAQPAADQVPAPDPQGSDDPPLCVAGCGTPVRWAGVACVPCACSQAEQRMRDEDASTDPVDPPRPTPQPVGGDGAAASDDPQHPHPDPPKPTAPPLVVEGEIVAPTNTSAPTGEAPGISQARRQIGQFVMAAAAFFRRADTGRGEAAGAERQAAQLVAAADTLIANMRNGRMDSETLAEAARMREQAVQLRAAAADMKKAADKLAAASDGLNAASTTTQTNMQRRHGHAEEAIKGTRSPAKTEYYKG